MEHDVDLGARPINGWWCQVLKGPLPILREVERLAGVRFGFGRSNRGSHPIEAFISL